MLYRCDKKGFFLTAQCVVSILKRIFLYVFIALGHNNDQGVWNMSADEAAQQEPVQPAECPVMTGPRVDCARVRDACCAVTHKAAVDTRGVGVQSRRCAQHAVNGHGVPWCVESRQAPCRRTRATLLRNGVARGGSTAPATQAQSLPYVYCLFIFT
eukprot:TRINITY_DN1992_c0_g1_i13.p1 TRINITY_DN1992_c0_g1~~TRINITY_DN1992_c0_g1_i13.p1  ORF type:complete len:156 (-),score=12.93 TRINITY_DN1992_c0_g1_i13:22-489(-)